MTASAASSSLDFASVFRAVSGIAVSLGMYQYQPVGMLSMQDCVTVWSSVVSLAKDLEEVDCGRV
jgi:hypothetical protein